MAKKNNTMMLVGIAAVIGAVWYFTKQPATAAAAVPAGGTPLPATPAGAIPGQVTTNSVQAAPAVDTSATSSFTNSNLDLVISQWFDTLDPANRAQAYAQYPNMTVDEKNQLGDIIVNVFDKFLKPSSAQTQFWNAWRVKYHIEDGTYA